LTDISPKKTLEGALAGLGGCVLTTVILSTVLQWPRSMLRFDFWVSTIIMLETLFSLVNCCIPHHEQNFSGRNSFWNINYMGCLLDLSDYLEIWIHVMIYSCYFRLLMSTYGLCILLCCVCEWQYFGGTLF
jgi:CDP-diglyceride synthetase